MDGFHLTMQNYICGYYRTTEIQYIKPINATMLCRNQEKNKAWC